MLDIFKNEQSVAVADTKLLNASNVTLLAVFKFHITLTSNSFVGG
jgi:hypothetical protein